MSAGLLILVTIAYVTVAFSEWLADNPPMAVVFIGYSLANIGLIWAIWR